MQDFATIHSTKSNRSLFRPSCTLSKVLEDVVSCILQVFSSKIVVYLRQRVQDSQNMLQYLCETGGHEMGGLFAPSNRMAAPTAVLANLSASEVCPVAAWAFSLSSGPRRESRAPVCQGTTWLWLWGPIFGQVQMVPFWLVGEFATHFRAYVSGDWDVHWGLTGVLTHGHIARVAVCFVWRVS